MAHVDECCEHCGRELREGRDGLDLCADCAERDTAVENAQHGMEKRGEARLAGDMADVSHEHARIYSECKCGGITVSRRSPGFCLKCSMEPYTLAPIDVAIRIGDATRLSAVLSRTQAQLAAARAEAERLRDALAACKHERDCAVSSISERLAQAEADARRVDWLETTQWLLQHFGNGEDTPPVVLSYGGKSYGGNTFRAAIDAAMEGGAG